MSKRTCSIHECEKPHFGKFLCNMHYFRLRKYGSTNAPRKVVKVCRMPGCDKPSRKLGWCVNHHSRLKRNGSPFDHAQSWTVGERTDCVVCGDPTTVGSGFRRYCSQSCAVMASRDGRHARSAVCGQCGNEISLIERHPSGRLKYSSSASCTRCRRPTNLQRFIPEIMDRDGIGCQLCGLVVDMELAYPDMMSKSVDHIIPWSLGGPDVLENYQLSHLLCNIKKQNRVDVAA